MREGPKPEQIIKFFDTGQGKEAKSPTANANKWLADNAGLVDITFRHMCMNSHSNLEIYIWYRPKE